MEPLMIAVIVAVFTLVVLFSGIPIAFGLSFVSIALLIAFEGFQMLDVFAETFYAYRIVVFSGRPPCSLPACLCAEGI